MHLIRYGLGRKLFINEKIFNRSNSLLIRGAGILLEQVMRACIQEAINGMTHDEGGPFGAAILKENELIALAHNTVIKTNDPTAHAEINALRQASEKLGRFDLSDCVLVTSSEPCPMCLSAIMWAGIKKVYYGCRVHDAEEIGFADKFIYDYLKDKSQNQPPIILEELLRDEALEAFELWQQKEDKVPY